MPGSHLVPPSDAPRGRALALRGGVPRLPWWRRALGPRSAGDADGQGVQMSGCAGWLGGWGSLSPCLPLLPLPGGLKVPPAGAKGGGGTRPPSDASLGDKCHLHHLLQRVSGGGAAAERGQAGQRHPGNRLWSRDTSTDQRGHRGGGQ